MHLIPHHAVVFFVFTDELVAHLHRDTWTVRSTQTLLSWLGSEAHPIGPELIFAITSSSHMLPTQTPTSFHHVPDRTPAVHLRHTPS
jgi:hypothetical protein